MREAWELARALGPGVEDFYWSDYEGLPRGASQWVAVAELLKRNRPFAAVQIVGLNLHALAILLLAVVVKAPQRGLRMCEGRTVGLGSRHSAS